MVPWHKMKKYKLMYLKILSLSETQEVNYLILRSISVLPLFKDDTVTLLWKIKHTPQDLPSPPFLATKLIITVVKSQNNQDELGLKWKGRDCIQKDLQHSWLVTGGAESTQRLGSKDRTWNRTRVYHLEVLSGDAGFSTFERIPDDANMLLALIYVK